MICGSANKINQSTLFIKHFKYSMVGQSAEHQRGQIKNNKIKINRKSITPSVVQMNTCAHIHTHTRTHTNQTKKKNRSTHFIMWHNLCSLELTTSLHCTEEIWSQSDQKEEFVKVQGLKITKILVKLHMLLKIVYFLLELISWVQESFFGGHVTFNILNI